MRKLVAFAVMLAISATAFGAVEDGQAAYVGGTIAGLKPGVIGTLDTTQELVLGFEHAGGRLAIPYAKVESWEYSQKLARHLGVVPTVAIALFKWPQQRHFVRISYRDEANLSQVAVFEVSKQAPQTLLAVLQARTPQTCKAAGPAQCRRRN